MGSLYKWSMANMLLIFPPWGIYLFIGGNQVWHQWLTHIKQAPRINIFPQHFNYPCIPWPTECLLHQVWMHIHLNHYSILRTCILTMLKYLSGFLTALGPKWGLFVSNCPYEYKEKVENTQSCVRMLFVLSWIVLGHLNATNTGK